MLLGYLNKSSKYRWTRTVKHGWWPGGQRQYQQCYQCEGRVQGPTVTLHNTTHFSFSCCVSRHVLYLVFTFQTYKICPMSSQFELENAIREATRMDTSLSKAAWKPRKALENTNTSLNISSGKCIRAEVPEVHSSVFKWTVFPLVMWSQVESCLIGELKLMRRNVVK